MHMCLYVCASSKHLKASGNKWKIPFFLIRKINWKITCSLPTHIKAGQSWCGIWQAPIPSSLCFSSILTHTSTVCMWREFCQLSRIFLSEAWFILFILLIYFQDERRFNHCCFLSWRLQCWKAAVAHAEILTLIFKIKARRQDGASDHCFHFESMCWCESLYSSTTSSDIDPYPHNCMSTCMWGYVGP